jgi:23S rRNA (guanosine2251-2'-O)-methyltransferase
VARGRQWENPLPLCRYALIGAEIQIVGENMEKPKWVIEKEQAKRKAEQETVWVFGLHAVRDALVNSKREKLRLVLTPNAYDKLKAEADASGMEIEKADPRKFPAPIDPESVHQGAAIEVRQLKWGSLDEVCMGDGVNAPVVVLLDRVTDPHNVGAVLRSAEVFGARAVIAPLRHSAPETGALAKTASGAMERQPYIRVTNLGDAMQQLQKMGYTLIGLDGDAEQSIEQAMQGLSGRAIGLVLGAEGPGMREKTLELCDRVARIGAAGEFGSLNVSNAAAVSLYAASRR